MLLCASVPAAFVPFVDSSVYSLVDQSVDRLVISKLVFGIAAIKFLTTQLAQLGNDLGSLLVELTAQEIVLGIDIEFGQKRKRLIVDRRVVANHGLGKFLDRRAVGQRERQVSITNVNNVGCVRNMGDFQIVEFSR